MANQTKVNKSYTANTGVANTFSWSGGFEVFKSTEVDVYLDSVKLTYTATTINESAAPREYSVDIAAKTIHIGGADLTSGKIIIQANTDVANARAVYQGGSSVASGDLNANQTQLLRKLSENDLSDATSFTTGDVAPSNPSDGDVWYDSEGGRTYVYYVDVDSGQWVESAPPFDADTETTANTLTFTQTGAGAVGRSVASKLHDTVSVKDFGAKGDGSNDDTAEIQAALDAAAGKSKVLLPEGTYMISGTINIPSNSHFIGEGKSSVIKGIATTGRDTTLVRTGRRGVKREHIVIEDMTLDFNTARHSVSGGERLTDTIDDTSVGGNALQNNNACCLSICYTEHALVRNVRALHAYKHCFDVTAPKYKRGIDGKTYDTEPSKYVTLENCYAEGAGDDNITTHHSTDITITGCTSKSPSGVLIPTNSNCFEIDDGSRNVFMTENLAISGHRGLQIKGHDYAPAPYNVVVDGFRAVNTREGFDIKHTGWFKDTSQHFLGNGSTTTFAMGSGYGATPHVFVEGVKKTISTHYTIVGENLIFDASHIPPAPSVAGRPNILVYKSEVDADEADATDEDGNVIHYTGLSPTAKNISLSNVHIIAPREYSSTPTVTYGAYSGGTTYTFDAKYGGRFRSYDNVSITNLSFSDSSFDVASDFSAATPLSSDSVFRVYNGARNVQIKNLSINGFSTTDKGFYTSSSCIGPFSLDGFVSQSGPQYPIRCSGNESLYYGSINNFYITGSHSDGHGAYVTARNVYVGHGYVTGYQNPVHGGEGEDDPAQPAPFWLQRAARSNGGDNTTPQTAIQLDLWEPVDPAQNLGAGDGTKISWGYAESGASSSLDVGFVGFEKENTTDANHRYTFVVGQSVDDDAPAPVTKFGIASNGGAFFKKTSTTLGSTALALSTGWHEVNANGNALTTITGGYTGQLLLLTVVTADLVVTDNAIGGGANTIVGGTTLDVSEGDTLLLMFDGTQWRNISFGNN